VCTCARRAAYSRFALLPMHDGARLEKYLQAFNWKAVVQEGGAMGAETLFIG